MSAVPIKNVMHVKEIAANTLSVLPIVTDSGRWIRVRTLEEMDLSGLSKQLREEGYRAKTHGPIVRATKPGLNWPDPDA